MPDTFNITLMIGAVVSVIVLLLIAIFSGLTINKYTSDSFIMTIMQTVIAQNPITANAGPDQIVEEGQTVTLQGSVNLDPNRIEINYSWEVEDKDNNCPILTSDGDKTDTLILTTQEVSEDCHYSYKFTVNYPNSGEFPATLSTSDVVEVTVKDVAVLPPELNQFVVEIEIEKDPINVGDQQTVTITAIDQVSNKIVVDASIKGKVTDQNGDTETLYDNDGKVIHRWIIESNTAPGQFTVTADASAEGYEPVQESKKFNVINGNGPEWSFPPWFWIIIICIILGGIGTYVAKQRHPRKPSSIDPEKSVYPHVEVITQGGMEEN